MAIGENEIILRFSARKTGKDGKRVEVVHFYRSTTGKIFQARCERGLVSSFLRRLNGSSIKSKSGKNVRLIGSNSDDFFRKLVVFTGCRQCTKKESKIPMIAEAVAGLGELETIFWYSRMIEEYERTGFWGVCRVAKAFRALHRID